MYIFDNLSAVTSTAIAQDRDDRLFAEGVAAWEQRERQLFQQAVDTFVDTYGVPPTQDAEHTLQRLMDRARRMAIN